MTTPASSGARPRSARSAGHSRSARRTRGHRPGPARSPSRCARVRARRRSDRGTARRRWPTAPVRARAQASRSRWTPRRPKWPAWMSLLILVAHGGESRCPRREDNRWRSRDGRRSPAQCVGAASPDAPTRPPAAARSGPRRSPWRLRNTGLLVAVNVSADGVRKWPVLRCRLMAEYEVAPRSSADLYLPRCAASRKCLTLVTRTGSRGAQRRPKAACP
jgi:hypothetical protein